MDLNSSSAGASQTSGFKYYDSFSLNNEQWETLNLPLSDTLQILFTQYTYFNVSSESRTISHKLINFPEVSTISTNLKSWVWKYFDKVIVYGAKRAQCLNVGRYWCFYK